MLAYSTRGEMRFRPLEWMPISRLDALQGGRRTVVHVGLMSVAIYWVNRQLPVARDALLQRMLIHVPLSMLFTDCLHLYECRGVDSPAPRAQRSRAGSARRSSRRPRARLYRLDVRLLGGRDDLCGARLPERLEGSRDSHGGLERLLSEARLATLRSQLDPHFLFNTLNSISLPTWRARPRQARLMLEQLGDLLRLSLEHADRQEIPLECELTFIDRATFNCSSCASPTVSACACALIRRCLSAAVPTFVLQPLVENAISPRHVEAVGVRHASNCPRGAVATACSARVRDNGPGLPAGWTLERHSGLGLRNTRARFEHLYGSGNYSFEVARDGDRGTCVDVTLPYRIA